MTTLTEEHQDVIADRDIQTFNRLLQARFYEMAQGELRDKTPEELEKMLEELEA